MTEHQRLFLVQARSNLEVFDLLRRQPELPSCHALHYLQMATEMLGKAFAWHQGRATTSHRALVKFLRGLTTNRQVQSRLGFEGRNENWQHSIRKAIPLAERIEDLAPALAKDAPNPEYPWPVHDPKFAPAEHEFEIWFELRGQSRQSFDLIRKLFAAAESFL